MTTEWTTMNKHPEAIAYDKYGVNQYGFSRAEWRIIDTPECDEALWPIGYPSDVTEEKRDRGND